MRIIAGILAAGLCRRFGYPKFLLLDGNRPIIINLINTALDVFDEVIVISGHYHKTLSKIVKQVDLVYNKNYIEGMSSSIKLLAKIGISRNFDGICIIPSDMPLIHRKMLLEIKTQFVEKKLDVVSFYKDSPVPPVIFSSKVFDQLIDLQGDKGAKSILKRQENKLAITGFEDYLVDIDTIDDYLKFIISCINLKKETK